MNIMKKKLVRITGIVFGAIAGLIVVGFAIYVILYFPRKAESFEINQANQTKNILIVTQGSGFKDILIKTLCDSLGAPSVYIRGIDVRDLAGVNEEEFDKIIIVISFIIRLNKNVERFIEQSSTPEKVLMFVTSGGADWQPQPQLKIDAITSASREVYVDDLVQLITGWTDSDIDQLWQADNYPLALLYFPRIDVKLACNAIAMEKELYRTLYPNLSILINRAGYQYLRLNMVPSALDVFKLNVALFPGSWNVYDSYGEVLLASGDREAAIKNYRKALEINPNSKSSGAMLKKLNK
jgi:tetratricopeptide (TPR) repeat protein